MSWAHYDKTGALIERGDDATRKVGDVVDRGGRYYRCVTAHGAAYQGTWGPPAAGVWTDIGAV